MQEEEMGIRLEDEPLIRELEYSTFYYAVPDKFKGRTSSIYKLLFITKCV
jgi:hypothetical protein